MGGHVERLRLPPIWPKPSPPVMMTSVPRAVVVLSLNPRHRCPAHRPRRSCPAPRRPENGRGRGAQADRGGPSTSLFRNRTRQTSRRPWRVARARRRARPEGTRGLRLRRGDAGRSWNRKEMAASWGQQDSSTKCGRTGPIPRARRLRRTRPHPIRLPPRPRNRRSARLSSPPQ